VTTKGGQHDHSADGLLRRFDDHRPDHWSDIIIDEADGSQRLRGGAFNWNPELSVALTQELDRLDVAYESVAEDPYTGMAYAATTVVRSFRSGNAEPSDVPEFEVLEDPQDPPPCWMQAHGLVVQQGIYSSKQRARDARRELGRRTFVPVMTSSGRLPDWERLLQSQVNTSETR
jgi:hypothetical protein